MSTKCVRCGEATRFFMVDLPTPSPICTPCWDVSNKIAPDDIEAWSEFAASCGMEIGASS